jgi:plasmid stabilization system protein ParE
VRLRYRAVARGDVEAARAWYAAHSPELESRFTAELDATLSTLLAHPRAFPVVRAQVRRAAMPVFPYLVYYLPESDAVVVLRVLHGKRHPDTWKRGGP